MDDLFTLASFATLSGAAVVVIVIVNALRHAFNWGPRWLGLVVSILVALGALYGTAGMGEEAKTADLGWIRYLMVFANGCLIYASAFGLQNTLLAKRPAKSDLSFQSAERGTERLTARSPW